MLKKLLKKICTSVVVAGLLFLSGCGFIVNQNPINSQSSESVEKIDQLIDLALSGNWKSTETEVQNAILAVLEQEGRSITNNLVKISKIDSATFTVPAKSNPLRSAILEECNEINFDAHR